MPWDSGPHRIIALEKVGDSTVGKLGKGHIYMYTYKSLNKREATARAKIALERDHPGENILHWKLVEA